MRKAQTTFLATLALFAGTTLAMAQNSEGGQRNEGQPPEHATEPGSSGGGSLSRQLTPGENMPMGQTTLGEESIVIITPRKNVIVIPAANGSTQ